MEQPAKNFPPEITAVVNGITERFGPARIYLFSNKRGEKGHTAGFKLCVILEHTDRAGTEHAIYLGIDSVVPFDIVLYTPGEWEELCARKGTFASRVARTGVLVCG